MFSFGWAKLNNWTNLILDFYGHFWLKAKKN